MGLLRPFVVFDCVATWASNSGSELFDVLLADSSPLDSCTFKWQWQVWDRIHSDFWSVLCPPAILTASLSHLLCGSNLLISRALKTQSAFPMRHSALLLRMPSQIHNLYLGFVLFMGSVEIRFANAFSPSGTNSCDGFWPCSLTNGFSPSRPF